MDDLMAGIGSSNGMNDINELAKQAEQALQTRSNTVQDQQSAVYSNAQSGYGQRSAEHKGEPQYTPTPDFYAAYNDKLNNDTDFMVIVKGAIGALIGAIPGFFFIMMLARYGLIASICGTVLAAGVFFGYYLGTRKNTFDIKKCGIVCGAVMIIAVFAAVRASWTYKLRDSLKMAKSFSYSYMDMTDMTEAEVEEVPGVVVDTGTGGHDLGGIDGGATAHS